MAFNMFPYSNLHRLNTDWVLEEIRKAQEAVQDAKEEVDAAVSIMEGYDEQLAALSQGLSTLSGTVTSLGSTVSTLGTTVAGQGDLITGLAGTVTSQGNAITALNNSAVKVTAQSWNDTQKGQARDNIGAASASSVSTLGTTVAGQGDLITGLTGTVTSQGNAITALNNSAVKVTAQTLTNAQKLQARQNIGAAAAGDTPSGGMLTCNVVEDSGGTYSLDGMTAAEIASAILDNFEPVALFLLPYDNSYALTLTDVRARELAAGVYTIQAQATMSRTVINISIQLTGGVTTVTVTESSMDIPEFEQVSGTTVSFRPVNGKYYDCTASAVDDLTITNTPLVNGLRGWSVCFTSGATPTRTSFPAAILGLDSFAAEANTIYEINVLDNRAVVGSWAVSSS